MKLADPDCQACKHRGLYFPGHFRACWKHTIPEWHERLNDVEERSKKFLPNGRWPYGPDGAAQARTDLTEWVEPLGLKLSTTRCNSLHWLRKGMCSNPPYCTPHGWMDHTTQWHLNGAPALVLTQPYRTAEEQREAMGDLVDDPELRVEIKPGWYGHGTIGAFVWRADVHEKLFIQF
ncbi:hypothetical protein ACIRPH_05245 [Nocardiopsis sp. NPDC101807]|uniref:hypothetical protein n=1 Tax=Nocardiopsis sp. NPDC101807 TaxID=3364339 RepID=UPI0038183885